MDSGVAGIIGALAGAVVGALIVLIPQYVGKLSITFTRLKISPMLHSMSKLTAALWGMVIAVAGTGIGFVIWYIQNTH